MLSATLDVFFNRIAPNGLSEYQVIARVTENDPLLATQSVIMSLDFGNGDSVSVPASPGLILYNAPRAYSSGNYVATLTAHNFRAPVPDVVVQTAIISVAANNTSSPIAPTPAPTYIAPIVPGGTGDGAPASWNFDVGYDLDVLASSVRLIFATNPGDQLMSPASGVDLSQYCFSNDIDAVTSGVQSTIIAALALQEPRVSVTGVSVTLGGADNRALTAAVTLKSNVSGLTFQVTHTFSPTSS